ncbi:MAG TPA: hypothetical protein VIM11_13265 [Tepidisphaeraceae bacterium]
MRPWLYLYLGWLFLQLFLVCTADCMVTPNLCATLLGVVALVQACSRADRVAGCAVCVISLALTYVLWSQAEERWHFLLAAWRNQVQSTQPAATSEPASSQPGDE